MRVSETDTWMGASAIELRGKFGVMDDRDRDPRTTTTLPRLPKHQRLIAGHCR